MHADLWLWCSGVIARGLAVAHGDQLCGHESRQEGCKHAQVVVHSHMCMWNVFHFSRLLHPDETAKTLPLFTGVCRAAFICSSRSGHCASQGLGCT